MRAATTLILLLMAARASHAACPRLCECKWRGGKESAVCIHASYTSLPAPLDAATQLLDLTGNAIVTIPDDAFSTAGLVNLQKLYLADCGLRELRRYALRALINLVELDISNNKLTFVPTSALAAARELRELKLGGNPITKLDDESFAGIPKVVRVDLSNCKISNVAPRAFFGVESSLAFLRLNGNLLKDLTATALNPLRALQGLELAGNPWVCTCSLRPLREWMLQRNIPATVTPVCAQPSRLESRAWDKLDLDEFACSPDVTPLEQNIRGSEGSEVALICRIGGVPAPKVRWLRSGRPLTNSTPVTGSSKRFIFLHDDGIISKLVIRSADMADATTYTCTAENRAGRAETIFTVVIEKKPPGITMGKTIFIFGIVLAALFTISLCFAFCIYGSKKKRNQRWNEQIVIQNRREESYEKIELNHKNTNDMNCTAKNVAPVTATLSTNIISSQPSVVTNVPRKHGDYRYVPSNDTEDEAEGYNEELETPTPTASTRKSNWRPMPAQNSDSFWTTNVHSRDLHIPRSNEYRIEGSSDSTPESALSSTSTGVIGILSNIRNQQNNNSFNNNVTFNQQETTVPNSFTKRTLNKDSASYLSSIPDRQNNQIISEMREKNYPDLIEISGNSNFIYSSRTTSIQPKDYSFCTLPRKRIGGAPRVMSSHLNTYQVSESQSPLLCESQYASSGGDSSVGSNLNRRMSTESYSNHQYNVLSKINQRSNSFLNLSTSTKSSRKNPSLPTSPQRKLPKTSTSSATPLLNLEDLQSKSEYSHTNDNIFVSDSPSYDFHALQLERFLEEYRSLQDQLLKMKETRENFQKRESMRFADPLIQNNGKSIPSDDGYPKPILKTRPSVAVTAASSSAAIPETPSSLAINARDYLDAGRYFNTNI